VDLDLLGQPTNEGMRQGAKTHGQRVAARAGERPVPPGALHARLETEVVVQQPGIEAQAGELGGPALDLEQLERAVAGNGALPRGGEASAAAGAPHRGGREEGRAAVAGAELEAPEARSGGVRPLALGEDLVGDPDERPAPPAAEHGVVAPGEDGPGD